MKDVTIYTDGIAGCARMRLCPHSRTALAEPLGDDNRRRRCTEIQQ